MQCHLKQEHLPCNGGGTSHFASSDGAKGKLKNIISEYILILIIQDLVDNYCRSIHCDHVTSVERYCDWKNSSVISGGSRRSILGGGGGGGGGGVK